MSDPISAAEKSRNDFEYKDVLYTSADVQAIKDIAEPLEEPGRAFCGNMHRVASLVRVVPRALWSESVRESLLNQVNLAVFGRIATTREESEDPSRKRDRDEAMRKLAWEEMRYWQNENDRLMRGVQLLEYVSLQALFKSEIAEGIQSIYQAAITGAWTAFEVLIEDLWVACLNARPRLGFIALDAEPLPDDSEGERERKKSKRTPVPVWMLRDPAFDPRKQMGDLLKAQRKWDFSRRDRAADAYKRVFANDVDTIQGILETEDLRWLAATRNVIVHRASVADKEFKKLCSRHPYFGKIDDGSTIVFRGAIVTELVNVAGAKGEELLRFSSDWLKANPT
ncbi:MAG: hypothetical protein WD847_18535 [Pirellulales bacterium]